MNRVRVYIAGPYASDPVQNTRRAVLTGVKLRRAGFLPFVPHLSMLWDLISPASAEFYLDMDFEWLRACDVVLRLSGESPGADREIAVAEEYEIPVFHSLDDLVKWAG